VHPEDRNYHAPFSIHPTSNERDHHHHNLTTVPPHIVSYINHEQSETGIARWLATEYVPHAQMIAPLSMVIRVYTYVDVSSFMAPTVAHGMY
jgi:hypothetical protein